MRKSAERSLRPLRRSFSVAIAASSCGIAARARARNIHKKAEDYIKGNRRTRAGAKQFRLRRFVSGGQEPPAQPLPALAPCVMAANLLVVQIAAVARRRVARFALRNPPQRRVDARGQRQQVSRNGVGATDEVSHEALEVVDQPALVVEHGARFGLLQFDAARHPGHECLRVFGQALEDPNEVAQDLVDFRHVDRVARRVVLQQQVQRLQPAGDVLERHGLQFGTALQSLQEHGEPRLDRLAAVREPVQEARAVEVGEARHARRIVLGFEIAPFGELGERGVHFLDARRAVGPEGLGEHFVGAQLQPVLPLGGSEQVEDAAVERRLVRAQVPEQFGGFAFDLHAKFIDPTLTAWAGGSGFRQECRSAHADARSC